MRRDLIILGAGGHAKVVVETARNCGFNPVALYDDNQTLVGTEVAGLLVKGRIEDLPENISGYAFVAIGANLARERIVGRFKNLDWATLIHGTSYVCNSASLGYGSLLCAGTIIQPEVKIGKHVIVNTGASIDHDCVIGDFVHICPGVSLAGAVRVGKGSFLGIGSTAIPQIKIGEWCLIGAGTVLIRDVPDKAKAVGVPARILPN